MSVTSFHLACVKRRLTCPFSSLSAKVNSVPTHSPVGNACPFDDGVFPQLRHFHVRSFRLAMTELDCLADLGGPVRVGRPPRFQALEGADRRVDVVPRPLDSDQMIDLRHLLHSIIGRKVSRLTSTPLFRLRDYVKTSIPPVRPWTLA